MKGFLVLYDKNMELVKEHALIKLPLKKDIINKRSEDMYGEPDPCIIYETAIINRFGLEILKKIEMTEPLGKIYNIGELNGLFGDCVNFSEDAAFGEFE